MDLVRELHSPEISHARARAQHFVLLRLMSDFDAMEAEVGLSNVDKEGRESLFILTRFFHRVNALRKAHLVQTGELFELFGAIFAYWWNFTYETQLMRTGWSLKESIKELHDWFEKYAAETLERQARWDDWLSAGGDARNLPKPVTSPPTALSVSMADELKKLWELQRNGVLTSDEFARGKAKLLPPH